MEGLATTRPQLLDLLRHMLVVQPAARASAAQLSSPREHQAEGAGAVLACQPAASSLAAEQVRLQQSLCSTIPGV